MLKILFGPTRGVELHRLAKKSPDSILIPEFFGSPANVELSITSWRKSKATVIVTTSCDTVFDWSVPEELFLCKTRSVLPLIKDAEFMGSYEVGIQHVSEILKDQGLWGGE